MKAEIKHQITYYSLMLTQCASIVSMLGVFLKICSNLEWCICATICLTIYAISWCILVTIHSIYLVKYRKIENKVGQNENNNKSTTTT
jgi:hypothetical protein